MVWGYNSSGIPDSPWERIYSPKPEYAHVTFDILDNPELELEAIKPTKTRRSPHFVREKKKKAIMDIPRPQP